MIHTSKMSHYCQIYRSRFVQFFIRPPLSQGMGYKHPVLHEQKWFKNKTEALRAVKKWERAMA